MGYGLPLMPNKCGMDEEVKSKGGCVRAPGAGGEAGEGWESGTQLKAWYSTLTPPLPRCSPVLSPCSRNNNVDHDSVYSVYGY